MALDPICLCGHSGEEHQEYAGRCDGRNWDGEYGEYSCLCHAFRRDYDQ